MMTPEVEENLQTEKVVELLNEITGSKQYLIEKNDFGVANLLGRCYEMVKNLHITNTEISRENRAITDHRRNIWAGLAMQGLLAKDGEQFDTPKQAFSLADNMVDYGKQESKTKGTEDGLGTTASKDNN